MPPTAQKTGNPAATPLPQLGGLTAKKFLRDHWQKKPLLIRNAFPAFEAPLTKAEVLELAGREEAESRLIVREGRQWQLRHGPFSRRDFSAVKNASWTVLVQDTQHFSHEAHALLKAFDFIPRARIDDVMVSYAVDGAGVGPHFDSYDVFLLQGAGRRRWQISAQRDLGLREGQPLKILAKFVPEQEFVLDTGDMLYLPPGYAHNGIAQGECLTWSIGFRAPSQQEISAALLDYLRDELPPGTQYADPDLDPATLPGLIDTAMIRRMTRLLAPVQQAVRDIAHVRRCLGRYLTEPKAHVYFDPPEKRLGEAAFRKAVLSRGLALDLRTRFLYDDAGFFMNGRELSISAADRKRICVFADDRTLSAKAAAALTPATLSALGQAHDSGYLHLR